MNKTYTYPLKKKKLNDFDYYNNIVFEQKIKDNLF